MAWRVADKRVLCQHKLRVVCIAGPTASGKTTFSHKLALALRAEGISASPLTVDHYYLPLDRQPKYQVPSCKTLRPRVAGDAHRPAFACLIACLTRSVQLAGRQTRQQRSDVDYDSIESMDVELVQEHIMALTQGQTVSTPIYNMKVTLACAPRRPPAAFPMMLMPISAHLLSAVCAFGTRTRIPGRRDTGKRSGRTCRCTDREVRRRCSSSRASTRSTRTTHPRSRPRRNSVSLSRH